MMDTHIAILDDEERMAEAASGAGREERQRAVFVMEASGGHRDQARARGPERMPQRERSAPRVDPIHRRRAHGFSAARFFGEGL